MSDIDVAAIRAEFASSRCDSSHWPCIAIDLCDEVERLQEALKAVIEVSTDEIYGQFMGGDPRLFVPDKDECNPGELAAHAAACFAWDRGEGTDRGPSCATFGDGSAYTRTGFGIGTTVFEADAVAVARAALDAVRS